MALAKKESYRDNPLLKKIGVEINYTEDQIQEYVKCSKDPLYFTKYMKIVTLDDGLVDYQPYDFQKRMISTFHENRFSICKISRQSGKCFCINTPIRVKNKKTGEVLELTVGEFYEMQKSKSDSNLSADKSE